mgnify:CR=1 FL=1
MHVTYPYIYIYRLLDLVICLFACSFKKFFFLLPVSREIRDRNCNKCFKCFLCFLFSCIYSPYLSSSSKSTSTSTLSTSAIQRKHVLFDWNRRLCLSWSQFSHYLFIIIYFLNIIIIIIIIQKQTNIYCIFMFICP